jgi:hypothetical protein
MAQQPVERPFDAISWGKKLLRKVTCPNCWHTFSPEDVLFVAKNPDLLGDSVLGGNEYQRFSPVIFTVKGEAVDPRGVPTTEMACPRCHLLVSEPLLEVPPMFISIIGSPASGKSYFLTTMTWQLRGLMPKMGLAFSDADPIVNAPIHEYEQTLFLNPKPDQPTEIRKTQRDDPHLHKTAIVDGVPIRFPLPLQFLLWPTSDHPNYADAQRVGRVVVVYDNAGEDFLPSIEDAGSAVVQHLARSAVLLMLFDPTQEPRLKGLFRTNDPQLVHGLRPDAGPAIVVRQEILLKEAAVRMRRYLGISQTARLQKPLIVVIPKSDIFDGLPGVSIAEEPYSGLKEKGPVHLRLTDVEQASERIRDILKEHCPEFIATAESTSESVRYIPVSSFGRSPELIRRGNQKFYGIRPQDIRPKWVTVPLLYCFCKWGQLVLCSTDRRQ